jgi:hypothetical protein
VEAHAALDRAVFAAYEWPTDLPNEEVLARLLALNLQRPRAAGHVLTEEASVKVHDEQAGAPSNTWCDSAGVGGSPLLPSVAPLCKRLARGWKSP